MLNPDVIVQKAKASTFYRTLLNWSLNRMVPFNKPHGFEIVELSDYRVKTRIPYKRRYFNHIKGLHACALATLSEFTTGFLLVSRLDAKKYRLIMKRLEMEYHYQGKMDACGEFIISEEWLSDKVFTPLQQLESVEVVCEVKIHDIKGNHLTTGQVHWHVKDWAKVKTKAVEG
jgi:acyl-coenzyme A thioesterase PaaI-like protein